jgi:hypothetical protein
MCPRISSGHIVLLWQTTGLIVLDPRHVRMHCHGEQIWVCVLQQPGKRASSEFWRSRCHNVCRMCWSLQDGHDSDKWTISISVQLCVGWMTRARRVEESSAKGKGQSARVMHVFRTVRQNSVSWYITPRREYVNELCCWPSILDKIQEYCISCQEIMVVKGWDSPSIWNVEGSILVAGVIDFSAWFQPLAVLSSRRVRPREGGG